jgi:hypothetical protein
VFRHSEGAEPWDLLIRPKEKGRDIVGVTLPKGLDARVAKLMGRGRPKIFISVSSLYMNHTFLWKTNMAFSSIFHSLLILSSLYPHILEIL